MSGSETGVVINMQQKSQLNNNSSNNNNSTSTPSQPVIHNMHLEYAADGTAVYRPVAGNGNGNAAEGECMNINMGMGMGMGMSMGMGMGGGEPVKRKRGRPRKYGPDGSMAVPPSSAPPPPFSQPPPAQQQPPAHHQQLPAQQQQQQQLPVGGGGGGSGSPPPTVKKARGRPPGSSKKQQVEYLGSLGIGFTPHVITVKAGEDVASRIMSFSQNGPRAICILSANGAISHVTLRQAATSGGSVTYEGRFEILSLSGSFMLSDTEGQRSRTGGLSVSLAGPDGRVLGGGVAGLLTAASPVQVVVGSFIADSRKEVNIAHQTEPFSAPSRLHTGIGATGASSPTSRGTLSESSGGPGSPLNQNTGAVNSTPPGMSGLPWK